MCPKCGLPLCIGNVSGRTPPPDGRMVTMEGYDGQRFLGNLRLGAVDEGGLSWKSSSWWVSFGSMNSGYLDTVSLSPFCGCATVQKVHMYGR